MFAKLTDFKYVRSGKQAFGFYIAYLVLIILISAMFGGVFGLLFSNADLRFSYSLGTIVSFISSLSLAFHIIKVRKLKDFKYLIMACLSGLLALFGGGLLGLIPVSYLTTKRK